MNEAMDLDNSKKESYGLLWAWNKVSEFLHHAQLIPFIVAVSGYHIFQVLNQHDKWWSSLPLAMFIDLLHYRTTQRAVETGKPLWWIGAILTTVATFMFQIIFYGLPGADGESLVLWQQILFSSVVPVGIIFMVWHHHENEVQQDVMGELVTLQNERDQLQHDNEGLQVDNTKLQEEKHTLQSERDQFQAESDRFQKEAEAFQSEIARLQIEAEKLQDISICWEFLNSRTQAAARVAAGLSSMEEMIEQLGISESTLRRDMGRINGHK